MVSGSNNCVASKKAVFHSLKYISSDVVGLLTSSNTNPSLSDCDAFPLSHTKITSPFATIGLEIVEEKYLTENKGKVVGLYESCTNYQKKEDDYVSPITMRLADVLKERNNLEKVIIVTYQFDTIAPSEASIPEPLKEKFEEIAKKNGIEKPNFDKELPEEAHRGNNTAMPYDLLLKGSLKVKVFDYMGNDQLTLRNTSDFDKKDIEKEVKANTYWKVIDVENHLEDASLCLRNNWVC